MALAAKYGILSDIHANYFALKAVAEHLQSAGVERLLCIGDVIGYGAQPQECVQAVREMPGVYGIAGNHDRQVIGDKDPRMRKTAAKVLEWSAERLAPESMRYLEELPQGLTLEDTFILVHGSLVERDAYILSGQEITKNLGCMVNDFPALKVCFFGHTHVPMLIDTKSVITDLRETKTFKLDRNNIYLINPGSVGQPRDKCPLASFGIFDTENWTMTFVRKPYDFRAAQQAIIDNGLPEKFARRLALGV